MRAGILLLHERPHIVFVQSLQHVLIACGLEELLHRVNCHTGTEEEGEGGGGGWRRKMKDTQEMIKVRKEASTMARDIAEVSPTMKTTLH